MRRVNFLLRIWVIVGAALLLLRTPKGGGGYAEYSPGSCINFAVGPQSCPSGCTISSFTQYTQASGNGVYFLSVYSRTPCGSAKKGKTCNNPTQFINTWDFPDCCAALGLDCTGVGKQYMNCCDANATCMVGTCCIPDSYSGCAKNSDCCSGGPCTNGTCQGSNCGQPGDNCSVDYPCCSGYTCSNPNGGGTCCPNSCPQCYNGSCCPSTCPEPACSNVSAYCSALCGCPYSNTCSDCYDGCSSGMSEGCASVCAECGVCC
jgi:hypothetical protein